MLLTPINHIFNTYTSYTACHVLKLHIISEKGIDKSS